MGHVYIYMLFETFVPSAKIYMALRLFYEDQFLYENDQCTRNHTSAVLMSFTVKEKIEKMSNIIYG